MFWRQLVAKYPDARIILTTRDPDKWFDSVTATVFSDQHRARLEGDRRTTAHADRGTDWIR